MSDSVDFMDFYGSGVLAGIVQRYWHERGHTNVIVERVEIFEGTWGVRSNLVAGLPPKSTAPADTMCWTNAEPFTFAKQSFKPGGTITFPDGSVGTVV